MTVTRTARLTGACLCAALASLVVVWLLRDLAVLGPSAELLRQWLGDGGSRGHGVAATSLVDLLLLVTCAGTAVLATRSRFAGPALTVTGLITLALRLPGLWVADADALVTTLLTLALATGLVMTAVVGRGADGGGPPRPRAGPALAAGILCLVGGLVRAAWEAREMLVLPPAQTVVRFTGGRALLLPGLAVPPGWLNAVLVLLLLAVAGCAFAQARTTRPLGLPTGLLLAGYGAMGIAAALRPAVPGPDLSGRLYDLTAGYELLAGIAVLVLLARPWHPRPAPYRPAPALPPAPPARRPPGW